MRKVNKDTGGNNGKAEPQAVTKQTSRATQETGTKECQAPGCAVGAASWADLAWPQLTGRWGLEAIAAKCS